MVDSYSLSSKNQPQFDLFLKQLEKYIEIDNVVAVLSAFPIFLFDYYGYSFISELIEAK